MAREIKGGFMIMDMTHGEDGKSTIRLTRDGAMKGIHAKNKADGERIAKRLATYDGPPGKGIQWRDLYTLKVEEFKAQGLSGEELAEAKRLLVCDLVEKRGND